MEKIKKIFANKKLFSFIACFCLCLAMCTMCFASEGAADYSTLVTQLNDGLGASAFIGVIGDVLPYIITVTIVALVWYLVKKAIKKFSKAKPGV